MAGVLSCSVLLVILVSLCAVRADLCTDPVCEYTFVIEQRSSHTYKNGTARHAVGLSGSTLITVPNLFYETVTGNPIPDSDFDDVITLDGHRRDVIVINGRFPGPTIDVLFGTEIVVKVINKLKRDTLTIHWHGMHQRKDLWMDGIPYLTQCPILPGRSFTYRFIADPVGTHWYHSHVAHQRADGLFGALLIHPHMPQPSYFAMTVIDWLHPWGEELSHDEPFFPSDGPGFHFVSSGTRLSFTGNLQSSFSFFSILVNGRGRQMNSAEKWPLEVFVVKKHGSNTYRFHVAHTGSEVPIRISVDQHMLSIVATDDGDIHKIMAESFWIFTAESIDFEIKANEAEDKYWIRLETIGTKDILGNPVAMMDYGRAVLRYDTAPANGDPTSQPIHCTTQHKCVVFNCPFSQYPSADNRVCVHMQDARTKYSQHLVNQHFGLNSPPDIEIMLNFNFMGPGASINAHSFIFPRAPFSMSVPDQITPCNPADCADGCDCTHMRPLAQDKIVQLTFTSYRAVPPENLHVTHVIHLHGNSFAVMKQGFLTQNETTGAALEDNLDVACVTPDCFTTQWTSGHPTGLNAMKPPLKNTVVVPPQGYTVVRFRTDNDGLWLLHCHFLRHTPKMAMIFQIGSPPPVPANFPVCDDF